jgi:hypothetical protein
MLFDLNLPCYLTTFSGKKSLSGKVICAYFCPAYRSSPVQMKSARFSSNREKIIKILEALKEAARERLNHRQNVISSIVCFHLLL